MRDGLTRRAGLGEAFDQVLAAAQTDAGWACTALYEWLGGAVVGYLRVQGVGEPEEVTSEVFLPILAPPSRISTARPTGWAHRRHWPLLCEDWPFQLGWAFPGRRIS